MTTTNRFALALVAVGTASAVAAGVVTLAIVGAPSAGAPVGTKINSTGTVVSGTYTATDRTSRGRHGGDAVVSVSHGGRVPLPASWPTAVPVPVGTIAASSTRPRVWLLMITEHGSMRQVRANVIRLYRAHGFIVRPQSTTLIVLANSKYRVSAFLASHDHSATTTDMRLELDARTPAAARA